MDFCIAVRSGTDNTEAQVIVLVVVVVVVIAAATVIAVVAVVRVNIPAPQVLLTAYP